MIRGALLAAVLLLLTACHPGRHARMQEELAALQAMNQSDSLLTDDSLALVLACYFDDHGTPNEQMEAHYLLGRTYADRGEAPAALAAYHDAIDRADTTAADCDYRQLCRVYAQMAVIFYDQNLMADNLECFEKSISYALKERDTIAALNMQAYKMLAYERTNRPELVLKVYAEVKKGLCAMGCIQDAAAFSSLAIDSYLKCGRTKEAKECIDFYESQSGYFSEDGNIEDGREAYYYLRGIYHLAVQELDSAYYYFRKELSKGLDYENQNSASRGLALYFQLVHKPDSAAFYSLYSYEMNDSVYASKTTYEVEHMHRMYNYLRYQEKALASEKHAKLEKEKSLALVFVTVSIVTAFLFVLLSIYRKRREERLQYEETKERLKMLDKELATLKEQQENFTFLRKTDEMNTDKEEQWREQEAELRQLIATKEKETERLKNKIAKFKSRFANLSGKYEVNTDTMRSETYALIKQLAEKREKIPENEWERILLLTRSESPDLYRFVNNNKTSIGINGSRICLLLCHPLRVKEVAILMGVQPSYISKLSTELLERLWKMPGSSKELKQVLAEMRDAF